MSQLSVSTFQACPVAGKPCSARLQLKFVKDPFYQITPTCFNTDSAKPNQIQCLPRGFQSIIPPETTDVNIWTIKNSIYDNCSPTDGADAGCGNNLQCNHYLLGSMQRYTCEPALKGPYKPGTGAVLTSDYEVAAWHQTCGTSPFSIFLYIQCGQNKLQAHSFALLLARMLMELLAQNRSALNLQRLLCCKREGSQRCFAIVDAQLTA